MRYFPRLPLHPFLSSIHLYPSVLSSQSLQLPPPSHSLASIPDFSLTLVYTVLSFMFASRTRRAFSSPRSARKSDHWSDEHIDQRVQSRKFALRNQENLGSRQYCARRASSTFSLIQSKWRSWFAGGPKSPSPTATDRLNPLKSSRTSRRTEIDGLRRYLGHPQSTVCRSELEPSSILFKIDPEHEVLSTWSFNSDGALQIPGDYAAAMFFIIAKS